MSWIKDNKFIGVLGGGTLVGAALLFFVGNQGSKRYDAAKEQFDAAAAEAADFEKSPLYPTTANFDGKSKALEDYRQSVEKLQSAFQGFRSKEIKNITPQEFTTHLLAANTEVRKAFEDAGTTVPEAFFVGFERYKTSLAAGSTTGILDYQLASIKNVMLALAKTKPSELKNFYRVGQPEDEGQAYTPGNAIARPFPLEITFVGPEKSAREFFSSLVDLGSEYAVIRSLRIANEKKDPPRASDAKFDKPAAAAGGAAAGGDPFGGGFVLPGDDAPAAGTEKPAAATAKPSSKSGDSSRILSQVLGNEQVQVFVRLDILQFLPAKKLP